MVYYILKRLIWAAVLMLAVTFVTFVIFFVLPAAPLGRGQIGTEDDAQRTEYLRRGLEVTTAAIDRGIDVRGFFHWTGVDNYEWLHGYDVSFGIIDRDRNVRPSAAVLKREALGR